MLSILSLKKLFDGVVIEYGIFSLNLLFFWIFFIFLIVLVVEMILDDWN